MLEVKTEVHEDGLERDKILSRKTKRPKTESQFCFSLKNFKELP